MRRIVRHLCKVVHSKNLIAKNLVAYDSNIAFHTADHRGDMSKWFKQLRKHWMSYLKIYSPYHALG
jgi:hypothetical protein